MGSQEQPQDDDNAMERVLSLERKLMPAVLIGREDSEALSMALRLSLEMLGPGTKLEPPIQRYYIPLQLWDELVTEYRMEWNTVECQGTNLWTMSNWIKTGRAQLYKENMAKCNGGYMSEELKGFGSFLMIKEVVVSRS